MSAKRNIQSKLSFAKSPLSTQKSVRSKLQHTQGRTASGISAVDKNPDQVDGSPSLRKETSSFASKETIPGINPSAEFDPKSKFSSKEGISYPQKSAETFSKENAMRSKERLSSEVPSRESKESAQPRRTTSTDFSRENEMRTDETASSTTKRKDVMEYAKNSLTPMMKTVETQKTLRSEAANKKKLKSNEKTQESGRHHRSDATEDSSSIESEEIIVYETPENQSYERKVIIGNLSRVGFREAFWHNKVGSYAVIISYLMSFDVVAQYFFLTHVHGFGFAFNYGFCMLFIGFPMAYLEMALGQFTSTGIYLVFDRMTPALVGVGISALLINFFSTTMDNGLAIIAMAVIEESLHILNSQMPWHHCVSEHDDRSCHVWSRSCDDISLDENPMIPDMASNYAYGGGVEFTFTQMGDTCVRPSLMSIYRGVNDLVPQSVEDKFATSSMNGWTNEGVYDFKTFKQYRYASSNYIVHTMLLVILCIFIVSRSRRTIVLYLSISLLLTFCVISLLLHLVLGLIQPKFPYAAPTTIDYQTALYGYKPWLAAVFLTIRSLKLGQGGLVFLGAQNGFHNNLILDCLLITIVMIFVPFFYTLYHVIAIDSYILETVKGDVSKLEIIEQFKKQSIYHNPAAIATVLLAANYIFDLHEPVVAFWYGIVTLCTTVSSKIVRYEIAIGAIVEAYAGLPDESSRFIIIIIVISLTTLLSFLFQTVNGFYRNAVLNFAVIPSLSGIVVLLELLTVGVFYGFRLFYSNTTLMVFGVSAEATGKKVKLFVNIVVMAFWAVVIPITISLVVFPFLVYTTNFGVVSIYEWILIMTVLAPVPLFCIYLVYNQHLQGNTLDTLFKRNPDLWGPRSRSNRYEAERAERMIRRWF